jgi:hypothetical protein
MYWEKIGDGFVSSSIYESHIYMKLCRFGSIDYTLLLFEILFAIIDAIETDSHSIVDNALNDNDRNRQFF